MGSELIKARMVKELGPDVLKRISDLNDDDRSSYLEPIVFTFREKNTVGYILNNEVIPIPEHYNNWQVFNNRDWELICKFDERALGYDHYKTAMNHKTTIDIEYKIHFNGNETIEEVFKIIEQHPSYGNFTRFKLIHGWTYELIWGT